MPSTSHSEVESFLLCTRKWYYGYARRLKRITESQSLASGSAGHKVLEAFYARILEAGDTLGEQQAVWGDALEAARATYDQLVVDGFTDGDGKRWPLAYILFDWYFENEPFVRNGWRVMAVEKKFSLKYDEEMDYKLPFVVDLIARDPEGKTVVIDHKFVWDFYTYEQSELQPQIPKYIGALRALNYKIDYGYYNMIRTRKVMGSKMLKAELVAAISSAIVEAKGDPKSDYDKPVDKHTVAELEQIAEDWGIETFTVEKDMVLSGFPLKPNSTRVQRTFLEQIETARQITEDYKSLVDDVLDLRSVRVANKMVCQSCSFKDICMSDLSGANSALLIKTEYTIRENRGEFDVTEEMEEVS